MSDLLPPHTTYLTKTLLPATDKHVHHLLPNHLKRFCPDSASTCQPACQEDCSKYA